MKFKSWLEEIELAQANDQGVQFVTGQPVTFRYLRGKDKAGNFGSKYLQDIEPAGRYMVHNENPGEVALSMEAGEMTFQSPLVIKFNPKDDTSYDDNNWKTSLSTHYGGKTGKDLSKAIRQDGYDGIVTVGMGPYAKEIVDISMF